MKRTFAVGTLLLAILFVFGCSLGSSTYYSENGLSCWEIDANDSDLIDILERVGFTKGSCPASYKTSKGCAYYEDSYDTTATMYYPDYTIDEMKSWCDSAGGELVN